MARDSDAALHGGIDEIVAMTDVARKLQDFGRCLCKMYRLAYERYINRICQPV